MSESEVLETLNRVVDRLDALENKLTALQTLKTVQERAPILVDAAATTAGRYLQDAQSRGIDVVERGQLALALAEKASDPELLLAVATLVERTELLDLALRGADAFQTLEQAGALDPVTLDFAAAATQALNETHQSAPQPVGPFAALMKMGDPDVKRAVGFGLALAKRLGHRLSTGTALTK